MRHIGTEKSAGLESDLPPHSAPGPAEVLRPPEPLEHALRQNSRSPASFRYQKARSPLFSDFRLRVRSSPVPQREPAPASHLPGTLQPQSRLKTWRLLL